MAEETMEVVRRRIVVPRPVRRLGVEEDDPRVGEAVLRVRPHVPVAVLAVRGGARALNQACWSLVWLMTRSMITRMPRRCASSTSRATSSTSRSQRAPCGSRRCHSRRLAAGSAGTAAARCSRRRATRDTRACSIRPDEIADAVVVAVVERTNRELVEDGPLEPERIVCEVDVRAVMTAGRTCRTCAGLLRRVEPDVVHRVPATCRSRRRASHGPRTAVRARCRARQGRATWWLRVDDVGRG